MAFPPVHILGLYDNDPPFKDKGWQAHKAGKHAPAFDLDDNDGFRNKPH